MKFFVLSHLAALILTFALFFGGWFGYLVAHEGRPDRPLEVYIYFVVGIQIAALVGGSCVLNLVISLVFQFLERRSFIQSWLPLVVAPALAWGVMLVIFVISDKGWPPPTFLSVVSESAISALPFAASFDVYWGVLLMSAAIRRPARMRRGLCTRCGYDLRGDLARACPECGWRREATS